LKRLSRTIASRLTALLLLPAIVTCGGGTEPEPVASIELTPATVTVEPGLTSQLTATARSAAGTALPGRAFTWAVGSATIASVSQTGLVTGLAEGTTTVSASAEGQTASATVNVRTPVATVTITPPNATLNVGAPPLQLTATMRSVSGVELPGRAVTWSTSSAAIATITATGSVTAVAPGVATITAVSEGRNGVTTVIVEDPCASSRAISVGQTLSGTLGTSDCRLADQTVLQAFRLSLSTTTTLEIQMASNAIDSYLFLTDAQGNILAEDDDGGTGNNARVLFTFAAGNYFILANTFDPNTYGTFQVTVTEAPLPCISARVIALPGAAPGVLSTTGSCRLNDDRYYDAYVFSLGQTQTVRFDLTSNAVDPFLFLVDQNGNAVAQDDDAGTGANSRIEVQLTPGQYFAFVTARPNQLGAYRLDVNSVIDPCGVTTRTIVPGQTQSSTLTTADCALTSSGPIPFTQRWLLNIATGQALQIDMTSSTVDAYLIVQNTANGPIIAENDDVNPPATNARISGFFPAGEYIVNATTFSFGEVGPYTLSVAPITTATPVSVAVAPNLSLTPGQTQQLTATVTGNANTAVTWESSATGIVTVSATGLVRAITPGNATITARSAADPSKTGTTAVTVSQSQTGAPNLDIATMYLVQSVQRLNGSVRLVANRAALARVFVRGSRTGITGASVRVRVMEGTTVLETLQGAVTPALTVDESCCAANFLIPASHIRNGVSIVADVDPANTITESNENDNSFPLNGTPQVLSVTTVPDLNIRLVPIRQNRSGLTGTTSTTLANMVRSIWPVQNVNVTTRATLGLDVSLPAEDFNVWFTMVQELELVRRAESSNLYYYGVVKVNYTQGVTGMAGGIPALSAVGVDESFGAEFSRFNLAHELGHAMGLRHAPCGGAAGPDPAYPFQGGQTGSYGVDVAGGGLLKGPTSTDIMGYCESKWVSAYNYNIVMDQRARFPNGVPAGMISPNVAPVLLVTGRVTAGQATVDGSFALDAQASIEDPAGRFVLEGFDAAGRSVFVHRFSPFTVSDSRPGDEAFVVGVPANPQLVASIARMELRELSGSRAHARVRADASSIGSSVVAARLGGGLRLTSTGMAQMVLVRNPSTGEVLAVSRSGALDLAGLAGVPEVELLISDGVASVRQRVNVATGAIIR
jgi:uncharacterized protein YjdB